MDTIIEYFSNMPTTHRSAVLVGGLAIFMMIESLAPLFDSKYNKVKHTGLNIFFTLTTVLVNLPLAFVLIKTSEWTASSSFGVLNWINMPTWADLLVGLMLMDLIGAYLVHFIEHKVTWMWQFHVIHHTDQNVDTTTANRHHPGESVIRFAFTALAILLVGAPIWLIFVYQTMSLVMTQFNHSNVSMPKWLDDALLLVFCTPNMHRVHHHYRQPYTDTNYGNIFSFWDKIFRTYSVVDNKKLKYGIDTYMERKEAGNLWDLLKLPFVGYRPPHDYEQEEKL